MKFEPWNEYKDPLPVLPIAAPPCLGCRYWRPVQVFPAAPDAEPLRSCTCDDARVARGAERAAANRRIEAFIVAGLDLT